MSNLDIEAALRSHRRPDGRYAAPEPHPGDKPDRHKPLHAALAAALREPPDPKHAAEAAQHLIEAFPNCRIGRAAYATGLADIVVDEGIPPCVVRHACRRVRAEAKSLPPLAELRTMMIAESRARLDLLIKVTFFSHQLADARERDMKEAERIAAAAARHGVTLDPGDLVDAWRGITVGWLHQRINLSAMRAGEDFEDADCLIAALEIGRPPEAFHDAAALVPELAEYERKRNEALLTAPEFGTPEGDAWYAQWPAAEEKFADRLAPIVAAFKRAHKL